MMLLCSIVYMSFILFLCIYMLTTLDQLEYQTSSSHSIVKVWKEVRVFFFIFLCIGGIVSMVVNRNLFANAFSDSLSPTRSQDSAYLDMQSTNIATISTS